MGYEKFGMGRHKPFGKWVQTTTKVEVVGTQHFLSDAKRFAAAVRKAEGNNQPYGVRLEAEPTNNYDPNAIMVYGWVRKPRLFGSAQIIEWPVGYLSRELAGELQDDLLSQGIPIAAELYSVFVNREWHEFDIIVLAPPGHSTKARYRKRA